MKTVAGRHSTFWQASEVLYARCGNCNRHMPWRVFYGTNHLVSSCCGYTYTAEPLLGAEKFRMTTQRVDPKNLILFPVLVDGTDTA